MRKTQRQKLRRAVSSLILSLAIGFGLLAYQMYPEPKEMVFEAGREIVRLMRTQMPSAGNPIVQDLYKKLPRAVVGKTYFGAVKGCIDPEYVELAYAPLRDPDDESASKKSREIFDLFVKEGKCIRETSLQYQYKVLSVKESFMVLADKYAFRYDKKTIGIVKIQVNASEWFDVPKVLYMTIFFPGVRT